MSTARAQRAADAARGAVERATGRAEDWGSNAAPRRPRNGHTADCPQQMEPIGRRGRCRFCWAQNHAREPSFQVQKQEDQQVRGVNEPPNNISASVKAAELGACPRCYYPTTDPERHCP